MKVLITGAFGNIGESTLRALFKLNKHEITCFDLETKNNRKLMSKLSNLNSFETIWGDITNYENVKRAISNKDCVIHLAAIIPPLSEAKPELAKKVNVIGTQNIIKACEESNRLPKLIFTSSISVHGPRMTSKPPRTPDEPLNPTDNYTHHKVECEKMIKASQLPWTIFRLGACPPLKLSGNTELISILFDTPLDQRIEFIHTRDVGIALANCVDSETNHKIFLIGGGEKCQMLYRDFVYKYLDTYGITGIPETAFKMPKNDNDWWYTDWMYTKDSQALLHYQNTSFNDYLQEIRTKLGFKRSLIKLVNPIAKWFLLKKSPYYKKKSGSDSGN